MTEIIGIVGLIVLIFGVIYIQRLITETGKIGLTEAIMLLGTMFLQASILMFIFDIIEKL